MQQPGSSGLPSVIPLQQMLVSGSKDGSLAVVDVALGRMIAFLPKVHYAESKNPFTMLSRVVTGSMSQGARRDRGTSRPLTSVVCLQDGVLTCGLDGVVRFLALLGDRLV